jgi:hypothetical protein
MDDLTKRLETLLAVLPLDRSAIFKSGRCLFPSQ